MRTLATGDRTAAETLVARHVGRLHAFAYRMLGSASDADDVTQDAFARLWEHAATWDPTRARVSTWLHRVASNLCIDRIRRRRADVADMDAMVAESDDGPARRAEAAELGSHVRVALESLPERQRLALILCHYQGLRQDEAAEVLGISVAALESLLARARRAMRERLRPVARDLLGDER